MIEIELLGDLRLHDVERIAGRTGLVNEQHAGGALLLADLVLVGPAAVVGHRLAAERLRIERVGVGGIGHRRIVDEHHERLALHVDALVVVPVELRRDHAVADKHQLGVVEARAVGHVLGPRDHIVVPLQALLLRALLEDERRAVRRDADERHLLDVGAVGVAGLETDLRELIDQVLDGRALRPWCRGRGLRTRRTTASWCAPAPRRRRCPAAGRSASAGCAARSSAVVSGAFGLEQAAVANRTASTSARILMM